ncbi:hypothetical protein GGI11_008506 [Coemansia sp. RSA 2049]|nr:hypothetical protein GGI11_008506 [Coemansia sp. RSA 2049]KAJ2641205.1 hypothetical protein GGH99_008962 [Coemansia sp. RSA 1285]
MREREEMAGSDDDEYGGAIAVLRTPSDVSDDERSVADDGNDSDEADQSFSSSESHDDNDDGYGSALDDLDDNNAKLSSIKKRALSEPEDDDRNHLPLKRRGRIVEVDDSAMTLQDQEQLALQLLGGV